MDASDSIDNVHTAIVAEVEKLIDKLADSIPIGVFSKEDFKI